MAEISVSLKSLREAHDKYHLRDEYPVQVFESADAVVMTLGSHLLRAMKRNPNRIFRDSIPMTSVGYSGIASWRMTPLQPNGKSRKGKAKR